MELRLFRNGVLGVLLVMLLAGIQTHCRSSSQNAGVPTSANTNREAAPDASTQKALELNFSADKTELRDGQCADLQLTVLNSGEQPVKWKSDWVFEQDGPTPPLPESFPRSELALPPGLTASVVSIRLCHSDLAPGSYNYRISAAPTSANPLHSNWLTIKVIR